MMLDASSESGNIHEEEERLSRIFLNSMIRMSRDDTSDGYCRTPVDATLDEVLKVIREEQFTRLPVYEEHIDRIIGIFNTKDLFYLLTNPQLTMPANEAFSLRSLMRPAMFEPETKKVASLFREMQQKRQQMVILIDEYGGTAGLVTIEDMVEEIVGNLQDEYDDDVQEIIFLGADEWRIAAFGECERCESGHSCIVARRI